MTEDLTRMSAAIAGKMEQLTLVRDALGMIETVVAELEKLGHPVSVRRSGGLSLSIDVDLGPADLLDPFAGLDGDAGAPSPRETSAPARSRPVQANFGSAPWTDDETRRAQALSAEGRNSREIGEILNRSAGAVRQRLTKVQSQGKPMPAAASHNVSQPITSDKDNPTRGTDGSGAEDLAAAADQSGPEGRPEQSLQAKAAATATPAKSAPPKRPGPPASPAPPSDIWSPELDLEMLDLLLSGTKAGVAAEILEIPKDEIVARYKVLVPCGSLRGQEKAIAAARGRMA